MKACGSAITGSHDEITGAGPLRKENTHMQTNILETLDLLYYDMKNL